MEEKKINNTEKNADEIYSDTPGLDPNLPWDDVLFSFDFPKEELSGEQKAIKNSEDLLYEKLFGELGKRFSYLALSGDERAKLFLEEKKDVSAALDYIPGHIALLKSINPEDHNLCYGLYRYIDDMTIANYSEEDINKFSSVWIDAVEDLEMLDMMQMQFYLLGKYDPGYGRRPINAATKKDFKRALEFIPIWINGVKVYDHDLELNWMVRCMRNCGYTEDEISLFATRYITELDMGDSLCYSSIFMRLFSEHQSGAYIDIEELGDFEKAIELLPEYINYITHYDKLISETQDNFDPDAVLGVCIMKMKKHNFSEETVIQFATEWMNALEKTKNNSYMRMSAYLFGEYSYTVCGKKNNYTTQRFAFPLINMKNFAKALDYIPSWVEYLHSSDAMWGHGYYISEQIPEVIDQMRSAGYANDDIKEFLCHVSKYDESFLKTFEEFDIQKGEKHENI